MEARLRQLEASRMQPRYFNRLTLLIPPAALFGKRSLASPRAKVRLVMPYPSLAASTLGDWVVPPADVDAEEM